MLYNAFNGQLNMDGAVMDYIRFGKGEKHLVMIPGLGDGLRTVKDTAVIMALMYRRFVKEYTVWMFSRKQPLEADCTIRTMAADLKKAMDMLGIEKAHIFGVSQGGMIAQWMAIDYPECVDKLVLTVTAPYTNDTIDTVAKTWIEMVEKEDYKAFTADNFDKSYSEKYLKMYRPLYPLIVPFVKPRDKERFLLQAKACLGHNALDWLEQIKHPTLVIGGGQDKIVTPQASELLAEKIENSQLYMYDDLGHALYEEAKDFNSRVMNFLK